VAVTTTASSPLASVADLVIPIPAPSKHDLSSKSSAQVAGPLLEQATLLLFDAAFHALSRELGKTPEALWPEHATWNSNSLEGERYATRTTTTRCAGLNSSWTWALN
jgi:D-arabinose 5-phosphate isomerase GutQ